MKTSGAVQRFAILEAVVQSEPAGISKVPGLLGTAMQQSPAQAKFLSQHLGWGNRFLCERGRKDKHICCLY